MPHELNRRQFLTSGGVALAAAALPTSLRRVLASGPTSPPGWGHGGGNGGGGNVLNQIKHVVVLMQENRSFDHYFGTLAGVRGFDDPHALMLPGGKSVFYQPDAEHPSGYMLPFHLDTHASSAQTRRGENCCR